jgi:hypothetical protein
VNVAEDVVMLQYRLILEQLVAELTLHLHRNPTNLNGSKNVTEGSTFISSFGLQMESIKQLQRCGGMTGIKFCGPSGFVMVGGGQPMLYNLI